MTVPPNIARPYPGIRPFRKSEYSIFYGRRAIVDEVLDLLGQRQLVVVHGSSGCGKSSLIKAGVLPRLEREHRLHGIEWRTTEMRPGGAPLMNLAEAFARMAEDLPDEVQPDFATVRKVRRLLSRGPQAIEALAQFIGAEEGRNFCILIDQFEEIFRFNEEISPEESEIFTSVLRGFADTPPPGLHAIVTMRSDFLGDCAQFIGFAELVNDTQYLLPRLNETQMMRAICQPARDFGGDVEAELAVRMISESRRMPDSLPMIQHCLMYLWTEAQRQPPPGDGGPHPVLRLEDYIGLTSTLSARAEAVLTRLEEATPDDVKIVEHMFRALIDIDARGRTTRRPVRRSALLKITGGDKQGFNRVLASFADRDTGFLFISRDDDPIVDITHEALIRCWDRLNDRTPDGAGGRPLGWLPREQEDERSWRALQVQAEKGDAISAETLTERERWFENLPSREWADRYGGGWDEVKSLIAMSIEHREREREREKAIRDARRTRRIWYFSLTATAVFAIMAGIATWNYFRAENNARRAERALEDVERERETVQLTAAALGTVMQTVWRVTEEAASFELDTATSPQVLRALVAMEYLPDKTAEENEIRRLLPEDPVIKAVLRDALSGVPPALESTDLTTPVEGLAVSPDGQRIAVADANRITTLDAADLSVVGSFRVDRPIIPATIGFSGGGEVVFAALAEREPPVWDPDGATMANGIRAWDLSGESRFDAPTQGAVTDLAISPDGATVVAGTSKGQILWLAADTGEEKVSVTLDGVPVAAVAFGPDDERVAVMNLGGAVLTIDANGTIRDYFDPPEPTLGLDMDWSPDGRFIAVLSPSSLIVWNVATTQIDRTYAADPSSEAIAFSPDSRLIAVTEDVDKTVRALPVGGEPATAPVAPALVSTSSRARAVSAIAWSGADKLLAGTSDAQLNLFNVPEAPVIPADIPTQDLIEKAKKDLDVCFSETERRNLQFFIPAPPAWCIELEKPPFDAAGRFFYGASLIEDGERAEGEEMIERAIALDSDLAERAGSVMAEKYVLSAEREMRRGDYRAAKEDLARAKELDESNYKQRVDFLLNDLIQNLVDPWLQAEDYRVRELSKTIIQIDASKLPEIKELYGKYERPWMP